MTVSIVSQEIRDEWNRLAEDPVVKGMADNIPDDAVGDGEWMKTNGFMMQANDEYHRRSSEHGRTIGAVATAIRMIKGLE